MITICFVICEVQFFSHVLSKPHFFFTYMLSIQHSFVNWVYLSWFSSIFYFLLKNIFAKEGIILSIRNCQKKALNQWRIVTMPESVARWRFIRKVTESSQITWLPVYHPVCFTVQLFPYILNWLDLVSVQGRCVKTMISFTLPLYL